jgi:hypothetical protein
MKFPQIKPGVYQFNSSYLSLTPTPESKAIYGTTLLKLKLLEQINEFVCMEILTNEGIYTGFKAIGIFKKNNNTFNLYVVSNTTNHSTYIITPKCFNKKSQVVLFEGIVVETSEYDPKKIIPTDATVSSIKIKWLHY